ncbi:MAG: hypothetical protein HPY50_07175 [Firmicutes bacterium]|nr:hypothetical protein [Bacillota bacterium]
MDKSRIFIYRQGNQYHETLVLPLGKRFYLEKAPFGVTNAWLKAFSVYEERMNYNNHGDPGTSISDVFLDLLGLYPYINPELHPKSPDEITTETLAYSFLAAEAKSILEERPSIFEPIPDSSTKDVMAYYIESRCIVSALYKWLFPEGHGRSGSRSRPFPTRRYSTFLEPGKHIPTPLPEVILGDSSTGRPECYLGEIRAKRVLQSVSDFKPGEKDDYKGAPKDGIYPAGDVIESLQGFLPLVWAEILFAVKKDMSARPCAWCGDWFPILRETARKKNKRRGETGNVGSQPFHKKYCSSQCSRQARSQRDASRRKNKRDQGQARR